MTKPSRYYRPHSLQDALERTQQPGSIALAGGSAALGNLDVRFETFVDLQGIPELSQVRRHDSGWYDIGTACSLQQVVELPGLPDVFRRALTRAITLNRRSGTSLGESLLYPARFAEWAAALLAHDIAVHQLLPDGEALTFAISEALLQPSNRDLRHGIITGISIPPLAAHDSLGAAWVARTPADAPIVCAAVFMRLDVSGCVETVYPVLSGASESPFITVSLGLAGQTPDESNIRRAVEAINSLRPVGDSIGSADYRAEMARVLLRRALLECAAGG